ncbi:hypothetical protein SAMN06265371_103103 [Lutibacter agarilyticus]|uniref:Uncharacterized protein n=1 Tax=Lutibacter agarilyticus TaxID=1109740 RepID=A0A238WDS4_9FLAO|nr:hypothetical protein [Lutibacter agarilyticus]SNR44511.1 hypothetical protein SAMN06265371_103103 [Lutibacter agarilyticus]
MHITKNKQFTQIKPEQDSVKDFFTDFMNRYSEFKNEHLLLDFSEKINTKIQDLFLFLDISTTHKENGTSFVIICQGIDIDDIPDEINVTPTFTEAVDILEMDAIERDLGF